MANITVNGITITTETDSEFDKVLGLIGAQQPQAEPEPVLSRRDLDDIMAQVRENARKEAEEVAQIALSHMPEAAAAEEAPAPPDPKPAPMKSMPVAAAELGYGRGVFVDRKGDIYIPRTPREALVVNALKKLSGSQSMTTRYFAEVHLGLTDKHQILAAMLMMSNMAKEGRGVIQDEHHKAYRLSFAGRNGTWVEEKRPEGALKRWTKARKVVAAQPRKRKARV